MSSEAGRPPMTEDEKREAEGLGRQARMMGGPLFVPPTMYRHLQANGVKMGDFAIPPQINERIVMPRFLTDEEIERLGLKS